MPIPVPGGQQGKLCLEAWITKALQSLNSHNGSADFNLRKPWRINRFGFFMGKGMHSNYEPDNWVAHGANRNDYMWNVYTTEAEFPTWKNADFNNAQVPGLRHHVRTCIAAQ